MCDCIRMVNEKLEQYNTRVDRTLAVVDGTFKVMGAVIRSSKIDEGKSGKPMQITASFCPFCGEKYEVEA